MDIRVIGKHGHDNVPREGRWSRSRETCWIQ